MLEIGIAACTVLLRRYAGADPDVELDAIRTAGTLVVGAGGAVALLLTARRQQTIERTLEHQREVAQAAERDSSEQRITELYTRAVDQLGAEKAPVRLGGLHALERLAQTNPSQRQTIVDVICAYLRMPYTPPDFIHPPHQDAPQDTHNRYEQQRQELQVRHTAQRILTKHLKPRTAGTFWADIDLNLSNSYLDAFDFDECQVRTVQFNGAHFAGWQVNFRKAQFGGNASFHLTTFDVLVNFSDAKFGGFVEFRETQFGWDAGFDRAQFTEAVSFLQAKFNMDAWFHETEFAGQAHFAFVEFTGNALFDGAHCIGDARFDFNAARARPPKEADHSWPTGWTTRNAAESEEEGWIYLVPTKDTTD